MCHEADWNQEDTIRIPLNQVEGDLEVRVAVEDGAVAEAWSCGTMYRGFENLLVGREAMDALVLTTRICGLCSTAHLAAASRALDMIARASVPGNARKLRNTTLAVEHVQSDMRQAFLMFCADFTNPAHQGLPSYEEAVRRYEPLKGRTAVGVLKQTRKVLEVIALLGGQWPHSAYMVPGGVASNPSVGDLLQCGALVSEFRRWYETSVLGCSIERWREVRSAADLGAWAEERDAHRQGDLGFFIRFSREAGLDRVGKGYGRFLSFGSLDLPDDTDGKTLVPSGVVADGRRVPFEPARVTEHVAYSWFKDYDGGRHPFDGETQPYATGEEGKKYSWAKAPRYDGAPTETGPLAEGLVAGDPLLTDLAAREGPSAFLRQLARVVRPATLLPSVETWLREMARTPNGLYHKTPPIEHGEGFGLIEAARGALGHWVKIADGRIRHYQVITPTAWNASPRDSDGRRGPWEEALVGTPVRDAANPVEVAHVIHSYDPCMVCCVHTLRRGAKVGSVRI